MASSHQQDREQCPAEVTALRDAARTVVKKRLGLADEVQIRRVVSDLGRWYVELERTWGSERETKRSRSKESVAAFLAEWSPHEEAEILVWLDRALVKGSEERPKKESKELATPPASRGFAALPYLVLDRLLSVMPDAAFKVYCALLRFEGYKSGAMWPGQRRLAENTGLAERTVWSSMTLLREAGLVKSRRRFGTSNVYERVAITPKNVEAIVAKLKARPIRKMSTADKRRLAQSRNG